MQDIRTGEKTLSAALIPYTRPNVRENADGQIIVDLDDYGKRKKGNEKAVQYLQSLSNETARIQFPDALSAARYLFRHYMALRADQIAKFRQIESYELFYTLEQWDIIDGMLRYFVGDNAGPYKTGKGFFLYGSPGSGKTDMMKIMSHLTRWMNSPRAFGWVHCPSLRDNAEVDKDYDPAKATVGLRCLDDLGENDAPINRHGTVSLISEKVLERAYQNYKNSGVLKHIISNKTPKEFFSNYPARIGDRMTEMFQSIEWPGVSHRKW